MEVEKRGGLGRCEGDAANAAEGHEYDEFGQEAAFPAGVPV